MKPKKPPVTAAKNHAHVDTPQKGMSHKRTRKIRTATQKAKADVIKWAKRIAPFIAQIFARLIADSLQTFIRTHFK